jgi:hypothetical protein
MNSFEFNPFFRTEETEISMGPMPVYGCDGRSEIRIEAICKIGLRDLELANGGIAYFQAQIKSDRITPPFSADILYFFCDNLTLINQFFMGRAVPVSHLTWKCDGNTTGQGRSGNWEGNYGFLRSLPQIMATKWFFLDEEYIVDDSLLAAEWPAELAEWRELCLGPLELVRVAKFQWMERDFVIFLTPAEEEN